MKVAPSILSADFSNLAKELQTIKDADWIHIDVMDGHFVPNLTIGPDIIRAIRPYSEQVFDTHLMITDPEYYLEAFIKAGSNQITFHVETAHNPMHLINYLHTHNIKAGLSLKPYTKVTTLLPFLAKLDLVLVMSVEPGFGGQTFMHEALEKIKWLNIYKDTHNLTYDIVVDGGINEQTALLCKEAGATVLVAGSYIFKSENRSEAIKKVRG